MVVVSQHVAGDHDGVSRATLFGLKDEVHSSVGDGVADAVSLVADDRVHILCRHNPRGRRDYMRQQRLASDFM